MRMDATRPLRRLIARTGLALLAITACLLTALVQAQSCPPWPPQTLEQRIDALKHTLDYHDHLYYQQQSPEISDAEYDALKQRYRALRQCLPNQQPSHNIEVGGTPAPGYAKRRHSQPMLSLDSASGLQTVKALFERVATLQPQADFIIQPKIDGLPVELTYRQGRLISAATRGDGWYGEDVTANVRRIRSIPQRLQAPQTAHTGLPDMVIVRGEVYAHLARYQPFADRYATARHFASAILRSQQPTPAQLDVLAFFPFDWTNAEAEGSGDASAARDSELLQQLHAWGFADTLAYTHGVTTLAEVERWYGHYASQRPVLPFLLDGIVVKVDQRHLRKRLGDTRSAPLWAAAAKFAPEQAITTVTAITFHTGRTGKITPKAQVAPIELAGIQIRYVSLSSPERLKALQLQPGDEVLIALAGGVIPVVKKVYPAGPRRALHIPATNLSDTACLTLEPGCRERFLARMVHLASRQGFNIQGLGRATLAKLVDQQLVRSPADLFRLTEEQWASVPSIGSKRAERLFTHVQQARTISLAHYLMALGVPGVGPALATTLQQRFQKLTALDEADLATLQSVAGIGPVTARRIRRFLDASEVQAIHAALQAVGIKVVFSTSRP